MRSYLQGLKLPNITQNENCDVSDVLEKISNTIARYEPQGSVSHRSEKSKVEYLYNSVICITWAKPALTQCYANRAMWKFYQLYTVWMLPCIQNRNILKITTRLPSKRWIYCGNHKECMKCRNTNLLLHHVLPKTSGISVTKDTFLRSNATTAISTVIWGGSVCSQNSAMKTSMKW